MTNAFSRPFFLASALTLCALFPLAALWLSEAGMRRALPLLVALGLVAAVVVPYLALGGASYKPTAVADPCQTREWRNPGGLSASLEQIALSALDGVACDLGVSREDLVLALRSEDALNAFADEHGIERAEAEQAIRTGLSVPSTTRTQRVPCRASSSAPCARRSRASRPGSCWTRSNSSATSCRSPLQERPAAAARSCSASCAIPANSQIATRSRSQGQRTTSAAAPAQAATR